MTGVTVADGKIQWHRHLVEDLGGILPKWGFCESPLVDGERVVVTPGGPKGALAALNKRTGDLIWRSREFTDEAHYASISEKGRFAQPDRAKEMAWSHPVIAHGKLYLRDQDDLLCYDLQAK